MHLRLASAIKYLTVSTQRKCAQGAHRDGSDVALTLPGASPRSGDSRAEGRPRV